MSEENDAVMIDRTVELVSAHVTNNSVASSELPQLIKDVYVALSSLANGAGAVEEEAPKEPFVPIKKSVTPDFIICLEDGKKLKMLKRHIKSKYGLSPDQYRERWGLPEDYPMVAPNYTVKRSQLAKQIGLGNRGS
ncbi:MAG: MucR family transcriptional regulator [Alphaproteobacteria bacterium]